MKRHSRYSSAIVATVLLMLFVSGVSARTHRRSLPEWDWKLGVSVAAIYNDNLLRLSDRDHDSFIADPGLFPVPLQSADDFETELSLQPQVLWRAPHNLMLTGDYRLKAVNRARNAFTDYQTHALGISVRPRVVGYRWSARFRTFVIPSSFLRAYRDRDYNEFHAARFANYDYEASLRYRPLSMLWLDGRIAWGSYYYNRKFTEYDSEYRDFTAGATYAAPWTAEFRGTYTRRISDNIGKSQSAALMPSFGDNPVEDTEYGDADFNEDEFYFGVSVAPAVFRSIPLKGLVNYRLRRRVYTTDRPLDLDPFHRGRVDNRYEITATIRAEWTEKWATDAYFTHEQRDTDSPWPSVPETKDFTRNEVGLILSHSIR